MNDLKKFSKGVSADFFRDALKYIDFPPEDFKPGEESDEERFDSSSQTLPRPVAGVTTSLPSGFSGGDFGNNGSDRKPSIAVNLPAAVSSIENFFSRNIPLQKLSTNATNAGCFFTEHLPADPVDCPPGFLRVTSSKDVSALESESQISQISAKKKMESARELNSPSVVAVTKQSQGVRTCLHCGSICTPQWRNGPTGQTLCNACGMRNRSGKLAPAPCPGAGSTRSSQGFKSQESECHVSKTLVKNKPRKQMKLNSPSVTKQSHGTKTCLHCGSAETPQWRNGPMGPKTLCNACGMRYKSGGLTEEYRPKASPMFDPSLHSNFRRKVKGLQNNLEVDQTQQPPPGS